jgi:hypothetical protein
MDILGAMRTWVGSGWTLPALIGGGIVVLMYVVAPLMVKRSQYHKAERELQPTLLEDLNATARDGMRRAVHDLRSEGFEVVGNYTTKGSVPGSTAVMVLFIRRASGDFAEGFFVATQNKESYNEVWTVAIRTRFADGLEIATVSSPSATIFPVNPTQDVINPYWIKDSRLLYAIHRARVEASGRAGQHRVLPPPGGEPDFLRAEHRRELRRVADAGYFWLDEPAGKYRPTLKGAYLMTWRLLWPLKGLRAAARRRKARRELQRLGFTDAAAMPAASL